MRSVFIALMSVLLGCSLTFGYASAQQQYRSKILLTPDGEWLNGADMSIEELEAQLGSIEESYARSSAGRHLARHYVERKEYDKAIAYYQEALAAEGLSDVANREMLRELAQVYLLKKDYPLAASTLQQALALDLVADPADYLLLARAYHQMGKYVDVVASLDQLQQARLTLSTVQKQQALALYYRAGAYAQSEGLLKQLLQVQPDEAQHWHLLASVYLQQNKKKQALDQLALAREKRVPFSERDILLLAGLQAANDNPYGGAQTLDAAMAAGEVSPSAENYRRLFEYWLRAREPGKAGQALQRAAQLSGDTELYLYLAQLQMEQEEFPAMHRTMLAACADELPDAFVGRANLLLGISQLKTGDSTGARRSFINATLIGGVNAQAGQWLSFMNADPATDEEARRIAGVCFGARDKQLRAEANPSGAAATAAVEVPDLEQGAGAFAIKTVDPMRLYYTDYNQPLAQLAEDLRSTVVSLTVSLVKSGGSVRGPLQIIVSGDLQRQGAEPEVQLGLPVGGPASGSSRFRVRTTESFKCAYLMFAESGQGLSQGLSSLAEAVQAANHQLTGEARIVIPEGANADNPGFEVQLGIR